MLSLAVTKDLLWSGLPPYVYAHFVSSNNGLYSLICIPAWVECPLLLIINAPAEQKILALNKQFKPCNTAMFRWDIKKRSHKGRIIDMNVVKLDTWAHTCANKATSTTPAVAEFKRFHLMKTDAAHSLLVGCNIHYCEHSEPLGHPPLIISLHLKPLCLLSPHH